MPRILALGSGVIDEISKLLLQAETLAQLPALASFAKTYPPPSAATWRASCWRLASRAQP
jgi:hypothetical protein